MDRYVSRWSRRDFLRLGTAGTAAAWVGTPAWAKKKRGARGKKEETDKIPVALQLYSVRKDCAKGFPPVLEAVAEMGYAGVEFAGYYGKSATELKKLLDDNGLKAPSTHTGFVALEGDNFERTVEFHKTIGAQFIIVPGMPPKFKETRQNWLDAAKAFNELAERLKEHGLRTGYHNHSIEFKPLEGELPWDTFFSNTCKEVVHQIDTGNCMSGGGDPVHFIRKYPQRTALVHLKEHGGAGNFGEGECPWDEVFEACETVGGTEWYIVEQEHYNQPPLDCVKQCLEFLKSKGRA